MQARDELGEGERLGEVVVAACVEAGQPVDERVARGQEQHRRLTPRARSAWQRSRPSASGRPMSITSTSGDGRDPLEASEAGRRRLDGEACLPQRRGRAAAQLVVVLDDQDGWATGSSSLLAQDRTERQPPDPQRGEQGGEEPGRRRRRRRAPPRNVQGMASVSGGGSKTCCSIATSISASSQPSTAASASAAASTSAASVQRNAADLPQRRAERGHRGELLAALGEADRDEERHRGGGEDERERLLDPADAGQVDGGDRADRLRCLRGGCP